jgi:hypothetical protein
MMTVVLGCEHEPSLQKSEEPQSASPPEEATTSESAGPTDLERLESLPSDASNQEIGLICLRIRKDQGSDSISSSLRQRCARAMLALAEEAASAPTALMSSNRWLDMATEFGASSSAISRTKRSIEKRESERAEKQVASGAAVEDESYANPGDVRQAKQLLNELPPACSGSSASASRDGTVTIRIVCNDGSKAMDGRIKIKNGIVTEVQ